MDDLFGTDSDNSDGEMKINSQPDELPSTQQHLDDLFGESDDDEEKHNSDNENQNNGSDEDVGHAQNDSGDDFNVRYQSDDDEVAPTPVRPNQQQVMKVEDHLLMMTVMMTCNQNKDENHLKEVIMMMHLG